MADEAKPYGFLRKLFSPRGANNDPNEPMISTSTDSRPSEGADEHEPQPPVLTSTGEESLETPLVTFVVPCYNSAEYMRRSIDSLLTASRLCEILLINDGSTDSTSKIAHEYASRYKQVIALDQENSNWGGVVNRGLKEARGLYFKVVDSDDHLDEHALRRVLDTLALAVEADTAPDLLVTNYVYDRVTDHSKHAITYRKLFPAGRVFEWHDMGEPGIDQFIMVHASWYRTQVLRDSGLTLPTGVSYMDSLLVLHPLPFVEKLFYLDVDCYHYLIGREGQSVEIEVVKRQIDQQLLASKLAIDDADYTALYAEEPNRALLMMGYVSCMMSVSTIYLFKIGTPEALEKNRQLWAYMREKNPTLYDNVKWSWAGRANRKTLPGRLIARFGYTFAQRIFKFA